MSKITNVIDISYWICLLLIAFSLPVFSVATTIPMILLSLVWLADPRWENKLRKVASNWLFWLMISYFLWIALGVIYTDNIASGIRDLRLKLPLLVLPLTIGAISFISRKKMEWIFAAFLGGCVIGIMMSIGYATWGYFTQGQNLFFYKDLVTLIHIHPSYFASFLIFGLFILIYIFSQKRNKKGVFFKVMIVACFVAFFVVIFLSSARMQIISLFLMMNVGLLLYSFFKKKWWMLVVLLVINAGAVLLLFTLDYPIKRFMYLKKIDYKYNESDSWNGLTVRLALWQCSLELIKEHPVLGVGTGDTKARLLDVYKEKNFKLGELRKYNSHNQYIQIWATNGSIGLVLFVSMVLVPMYFGIKHLSPLYLGFLTILALSMISESMLEHQYGVVFYGFFNSLFIFHWKIPPKKFKIGFIHLKKPTHK